MDDFAGLVADLFLTRRALSSRLPQVQSLWLQCALEYQTSDTLSGFPNIGGPVLLSDVRIVLVETSHPGNIGAVARAMKNMCLSDLALVTPNKFPSANATARASGADDILANADVCESLQQAIGDCDLVIGASARSRTISWPEIDTRESLRSVLRDNPNLRTAIVFGREHSGLTNEEMDRCQYLLKIPCNPKFSSLNVAAAVQLVAYEIFLASYDHQIVESESGVLANSAQLESFFDHLHGTLVDIGFMHPDKSRSIMRRLRRVFHRARLEIKEIDILRGILSAAQGKKRRR